MCCLIIARCSRSPVLHSTSFRHSSRRDSSSLLGRDGSFGSPLDFHDVMMSGKHRGALLLLISGFCSTDTEAEVGGLEGWDQRKGCPHYTCVVVEFLIVHQASSDTTPVGDYLVTDWWGVMDKISPMVSTETINGKGLVTGWWE